MECTKIQETIKQRSCKQMKLKQYSEYFKNINPKISDFYKYPLSVHATKNTITYFSYIESSSHDIYIESIVNTIKNRYVTKIGIKEIQRINDL